MRFAFLLTICLASTSIADEQIRVVAAPLMLQASEITEPTRFIVEQDLGEQYAVTIVGNWKPRDNPESEDRFDGPIAPITIECGYFCKGLKLYRVDNADIGPIAVIESQGEAIEISQVRQSEFASVRCHRCKSDRSVVLFSAVAGSYSSNMLNFGQFVTMACDAPVTIQFQNCEDSANALRLMTFAQLICHPAWEPARKQFPKLESFRPRKRTHVDFANAESITVVSCNMRLDPKDFDGSLTFKSAEKSRRVLVGNGQILRRRGEDWQTFVSGGVRVFP